MTKKNLIEDDKVIKAFSSNVFKCREYLGLTIKELSIRSGLTEAAISQIENGKRIPSLPSVLRLSRGLGMKLSKLLSEKDDD